MKNKINTQKNKENKNKIKVDQINKETNLIKFMF